MSCSAIMMANPPTISADESIGGAVTKLVSQHHANLPVVDGAGRYMGMFGLDDLLGLLVPRVALAGNLSSNIRFIMDDPGELQRKYDEVKSRCVGELANRNAATLEADTPEIEAFRLFCRNHDSMAVVDKQSGQVLGMVSSWDAVRGLTRPSA